jgi:hypothetical protein
VRLTDRLHADTIARLRAEPLFVEHKLCAGCRANSWRGEVLVGASIYSELDAFGGLVIVPGAAVMHGLRYIQFCVLSADTQLTLSLRLQSEGERVAAVLRSMLWLESDAMRLVLTRCIYRARCQCSATC